MYPKSYNKFTFYPFGEFFWRGLNGYIQNLSYVMFVLSLRR